MSWFGRCVELHSLKRADLNGCRGTVVSRSSAPGGRLGVKLPGMPVMAFKVENLKAVLQLGELSDDELLSVLTRVKRKHARSLPLVCSRFNSLIRSPAFHDTRHLQGLAQVLIVFGGTFSYNERFNRTVHAVLEADTDVKWVRLADMTTISTATEPRAPSRAVVGNELLLMGSYQTSGASADGSQDVHCYSIVNNAWRVLCDVPPVARKREGAACESFDNTVIYVGGGDGTDVSQPASAEAWKLNIATLSWSTLPAMPYAVEYAASFVLHGRYLFVVGGSGDDGSWVGGIGQAAVPNRDARWTQRFDIKTETWSIKASLPEGYGGCISVGCLVDGGMFEILKGDGFDKYTRLRYQPQSDSWEVLAAVRNFPLNSPLRAASYDGGMAVVGDHGHIAIVKDGVVTTVLPQVPDLSCLEAAQIVSFPSSLLPLALAKSLLAKSTVASQPAEGGGLPGASGSECAQM